MEKITKAIKLWEDWIITKDECIEEILSSINESNVENAMQIIPPEIMEGLKEWARLMPSSEREWENYKMLCVDRSKTININGYKNLPLMEYRKPPKEILKSQQNLTKLIRSFLDKNEKEKTEQGNFSGRKKPRR